jgi:hypothetical protein
VTRCFPSRGPTGSATSSPGASLTRLDGAGHVTPLERPRDFAVAIIEAATARAGTPQHDTVPADLADAIARDEQAGAAFAALPNSHRMEWVRRVGGAKKPETRARRIAKTVQSLRKGQPAS